jgi:hypothetical protein
MMLLLLRITQLPSKNYQYFQGNLSQTIRSQAPKIVMQDQGEGSETRHW